MGGVSLVVIFFYQGAFAANNQGVVVREGMRITSLQEHVFILEDANSVLDRDFVVAKFLESKGSYTPPNKLHFGSTRSAFWLVFEIANPNDESISALIEQAYPLIDYIDLWYRLPTGDWKYFPTGDRRPFSNKPLPHRLFLFPVQLPAHSDSVVVMRFQTFSPMTIDLRITDKDQYAFQARWDTMQHGGYFGGILLLLLYNLILFIALRDRTYAYYLLFAVAWTSSIAIQGGFFFQYVWPDWPTNITNRLFILVAGLVCLFALEFSRRICNLKAHYPLLNNLAVVLGMVSLLIVAFTPVVDYGTVGYQAVAIAIGIITGIVFLYIFFFGLLCVWKGDLSSRYFMCGWTVLVAVVLLNVVKDTGADVPDFVNAKLLEFGSLVEMVLLSLALGARYNEALRAGYADSLSALGNRRQLNERLPMELKMAKSSGYPLSLILIDIDHFKKVNDNWGHPVGDEVLKAIGEVLGANVRKPHFACRYGGEEFTVTLAKTSESDAALVAERLRVIIANTAIGKLRVTASFGVASTSSATIDNVDDLLRATDQALYAAKHEGRNRVCRYSSIHSSQAAQVSPESS